MSSGLIWSKAKSTTLIWSTANLNCWSGQRQTLIDNIDLVKGKINNICSLQKLISTNIFLRHLQRCFSRGKQQRERRLSLENSHHAGMFPVYRGTFALLVLDLTDRQLHYSSSATIQILSNIEDLAKRAGRRRDDSHSSTRRSLCQDLIRKHQESIQYFWGSLLAS